jgi:hypothetical protein
MTSDETGVDIPVGDTWSATRSRVAAFTRLHADGALADVPCPACGYPTLPEHGARHICVLCHWQDDGSSGDEPDRPSARNHGLTLRQAVAHIGATGVFAAPVFAATAPAYYTPRARAARVALSEAYDRLRLSPRDPAAHAAVRTGRADVMIAIVQAMH